MRLKLYEQKIKSEIPDKVLEARLKLIEHKLKLLEDSLDNTSLEKTDQCSASSASTNKTKSSTPKNPPTEVMGIKNMLIKQNGRH
jgi:hypothetical protein